MQNVQSLISATRGFHANRTSVRNAEGAPAYHRSLQEQVVQVLTTGTLSDTFYVSARQLGAEAIEVLVRAREEHPEFLARALVYAREEGFMKTLPVLGLVVLSGGRGRTRQLFEAVFDRVIRTPDDLRAFVALSVAGTVPGRRGLGGVACVATRNWLQRLSEYHALKYGSAASREVTLRDIVRMTHPRPSTPALSERFGWLVGGVEKLGSDPALNPQIRAFEALKRAETELDTVTLIREGRLPYEVVLPAVKATTSAIWAELLRNAPYMNLLRNLATFHRHGVFAQETNVRLAVAKLTDPRAVERSKVLPFRFFDAWKAYTGGNAPDSRIADALRTALELSFRNMPSLGNRVTCIGTDVSGSMNDPVSAKGTTRFIDIAGIFTGALLRRVENRVIPLPFHYDVHENCGLSACDDVLATAEKISRLCGGGTAIGAPVQYLLDRKIKVDLFIGVTDNVDWAFGPDMSCKESFLGLWRCYRNEVAPDARAYLVTIAPYREVVAPSGAKGVRFIYGWSDRVLSYIASDLEAGTSQVERIERMELSPAADPNGSSPSDASSPCDGEDDENAQQEDDSDA
jgi:60 kDa SS-A/Ro ribonucleoprotein